MTIRSETSQQLKLPTVEDIQNAHFEYQQRTGRIYYCRGAVRRHIATGYAGAGIGVNSPRVEHIRSFGPLPRGRYKMATVDHPRFAAPAIRLTQTEGETFGRSGFWVHGDNRHLNRTASTGCIILGRIARRELDGLVRAHPNITLVVVSGD